MSPGDVSIDVSETRSHRTDGSSEADDSASESGSNGSSRTEASDSADEDSSTEESGGQHDGRSAGYGLGIGPPIQPHALPAPGGPEASPVASTTGAPARAVSSAATQGPSSRRPSVTASRRLLASGSSAPIHLLPKPQSSHSRAWIERDAHIVPGGASGGEDGTDGLGARRGVTLPRPPRLGIGPTPCPPPTLTGPSSALPWPSQPFRGSAGGISSPSRAFSGVPLTMGDSEVARESPQTVQSDSDG